MSEFFVPSDAVRQWFTARIAEKRRLADSAQWPDIASALMEDANVLERAMVELLSKEQYIHGVVKK